MSLTTAVFHTRREPYHAGKQHWPECECVEESIRKKRDVPIWTVIGLAVLVGAASTARHWFPVPLGLII